MTLLYAPWWKSGDPTFSIFIAEPYSMSGAVKLIFFKKIIKISQRPVGFDKDD